MFPNAGGTIELFKSLSSELQSEFDCFSFEYPGHGTNKNGFCETIDLLVDNALMFFLNHHLPGTDYILMGYSMGSIVIMELLSRLKTQNTNSPMGVIIAADPPINMLSENVYFTEEQCIKAFYMKNGNISEKLMNSKLFRRIYLPSFRNDYRIMKSYNYSELIKKEFDIRALIFYCEEDTPLEIMHGWDSCFVEAPKYIHFSGGHFFIKDHVKEISKEIISYF